MCGIRGFTGHRNDQKAVIERMMKSIEHRGQTVKALFVVAENYPGFQKAQYY